MKTVTKGQVKLLYALHDMCVGGFYVVGDDLLMKMQSGIIKMDCLENQVEGNVRFCNVDWDFSYVYIIDFKNSNGKFDGEKICLKDFVNKYSKCKVEIIDESYGINLAKLNGYVIDKNYYKECIIEISHLGNVQYITM